MTNDSTNLDISVIKKVNENVAFFNDVSGITNKIIIKSKEEIISKMLVDYSLSMSATYALDSAIDLIDAAYIKINEKYSVNMVMSTRDKSTILGIIRNIYSIRDLEDISWLLEDVRVYLWVLGLLDKPSFDKECDINDINKILFGIKDYNELLNRCNIRSKEEILDYFNLVIKNRNINRSDINPLVIQEQIDALSFVTSYNAIEDLKALISVNYKNDDINIEFNVPEDLVFNKIGNNTKELFTLSSNDKKTKMVMFDFGILNGDFEEKVKKYQDLFDRNGFKVINKYTFNSHNLKNKIHQTLISKYYIVLNSYLFEIANHIFRLDSLVNNNTNYNDYNELISSKNSSIDMDLLFSIKEHEIKEDNQVLHEYNYSNLLPTKSNINEIIKEFEEVYNKILKNKRSGKLELNILVDSAYGENITCNNYEEYLEYDEIGYLNKVNRLVISLIVNKIDINTKSDNLFEIEFEPYNIIFTRKSSKKEEKMDQVEEYIISFLKKLPVSNTIFYTK